MLKATLMAITDAGSVPAEPRPFVELRATMERRAVGPKDVVAIFNVHGTSSHFVVFLDAGRTMEQVDAEIAPHEVVVSREARERIASALETQALHKQATGWLAGWSREPPQGRPGTVPDRHWGRGGLLRSCCPASA